MKFKRFKKVTWHQINEELSSCLRIRVSWIDGKKPKEFYIDDQKNKTKVTVHHDSDLPELIRVLQYIQKSINDGYKVHTDQKENNTRLR